MNVAIFGMPLTPYNFITTNAKNIGCCYNVDVADIVNADIKRVIFRITHIFSAVIIIYRNTTTPYCDHIPIIWSENSSSALYIAITKII